MLEMETERVLICIFYIHTAFIMCVHLAKIRPAQKLPYFLFPYRHSFHSIVKWVDGNDGHPETNGSMNFACGSTFRAVPAFLNLPYQTSFAYITHWSEKCHQNAIIDFSGAHKCIKHRA